MIIISETFTVAADETYEATDGDPVFYSVHNQDSSTGDFFNFGTIRAVSENHPTAIYFEVVNGPRGGVVLDNQGLIEARAPQGAPIGSGNAYAIYVEQSGPDWILNSGHISATAYQFATGIRNYYSPTVHNLATGVIEATTLGSSGFDTYAIRLENGGDVINDGLIRATGNGFVHAVYIDRFELSPLTYSGPHRTGQVINNGEIIAEAPESLRYTHSYGIRVRSSEDWTLEEQPNIINYGTITAEFAIYSEGASHVINDGVLNGHVVLGGYGDKLFNTDQINGYVDLGYGDDLFDNRGGVVTGLIQAGDGDDVIWGGDGAERIDPGFGADIIYAGGGDDVIEFAHAQDMIDGGDGDDTIIYLLGDLTVNLTEGWVRSGDFQSTIVHVEHVAAADGTDVLIGNSQVNNLNGGGDIDLLQGMNGADILAGGEGADQLDGGQGIDTASYEHSAVGVTVNLATPTANTGDAAGDTFISIENLSGSVFNDILGGDNGTNTLWGSAGADTLNGGAGDDTLVGGAGADTMRGGEGDDLYDIDSFNDVVVELGGQGVDLVRSRVTYTLGDNVENLTLLTPNNINGFGNNLGNVMTGNAGNNLLKAGNGHDTLVGGAGNDTLQGQGGADAMTGGVGNDTYYVDNINDTVTELGGEGSDRVYARIDYALGANVETLVLLGAADLDGLGNGLNNTVMGNEGDNRLEGRAGNDLLNGGAGSDILIGGQGADIFVFGAPLGAGNIDAITDFSVADDAIRLKTSAFSEIGVGMLAASAFHVGASAADAGDRIVYNSTTGALYYDPDGAGGAAQIQFAQLSTGLALTNADFFGV